MADNDRVAVLEPRPDLPAGSMPVLAEVLRTGRRIGQGTAISSVVLVLLGVLLALGDFGIAIPLLLLAVFVPYLVAFVWIALMYIHAEKQLGTAFRLLHLADEGALGSRWTVSLAVPGEKADWLVVWLPKAGRLQLAGQRRVWVLGPDRRGHVFVQLPGRLSLYPARLRSAPRAGSEPLPVVLREPSAPNEDPVLKAFARQLSFKLWLASGLYLGFAGFTFWIRADFPVQTGFWKDFVPLMTPALTVAFALVAVVTGWMAFRYGRRLADTWTELRVVVDRPVQAAPQMTAKLTGRTVLPGGREVTFRLSNVEPSLAANIATTGQLWIAGVPRPGKRARAAVPGYPVLGGVRIGS